MIKKICIAILVLLCSCKQIKSEQKEIDKTDSIRKIDSISQENIETDYESNKSLDAILNTDTILSLEMYWKKMVELDSLKKEIKTSFANSFPLKNKTVIVLRDKKEYSLMNQNYCKTISEPERAALGYIGMFYGSLSRFDTDINKYCTILMALNLDKEYSKKFKTFMRFWFRNDNSSLQAIDHCYPLAYASSSFYYYKEIILTVKENKIYINYTGKGYSRDIWTSTWKGKMVFLVSKDNIKLIDRNNSDDEYVYYYPNYSDIKPPSGYINNGRNEYRLPKKSKKK